MDDFFDRRAEPGWMRELRHIGALGDWIHADYFASDTTWQVCDELLDAGYMVPGVRDRHATFELTDAGKARCRELGAA